MAIAGAGIAGMTAALFLEKLKYRVLLFERAKRPAETGTGIQISPNAFKVLELLGLGRSVGLAGFAPDSIEIGSGKSGKRLTEFKLGGDILTRHKAPYTVIHRVDLARVLRTACEDREDIELLDGHLVTDIASHANGVTLLSEGPDGASEHVVAATIGADGAWSSLRRFVHGASKPRFTGQIAWRALVDMEQAHPSLSRRNTGLWLGPNSHLVHYPIRAGSLLNVVAVTPWTKDYTPHRGWLNQSVIDDRATSFIGWQTHLRDLVNTEADWGGWPIYSVEKVANFANGPLCLIGDAAHAMVPYGAQGGACAIEDAFVLAAQCAQHPEDLPTAFSKFEKIRKPRIEAVLKLSINNRRIYHMARPMSWMRNLAMTLTPQRTLQARMDPIYGWDPASTRNSELTSDMVRRKLSGMIAGSSD